MFKRIVYWFCKHVHGHKYVKTWNRKRNGYIYKCVRCGKPRDETKE